MGKNILFHGLLSLWKRHVEILKEFTGDFFVVWNVYEQYQKHCGKKVLGLTLKQKKALKYLESIYHKENENFSIQNQDSEDNSENYF